jgi:hypothetical protein
MLDMNPEFFTIERLKETGLWDSYSFLSAYGMLPYLNRMKQESLVGAEVGVLKGENIYTLLELCPKISKIYGIDLYKEHKDYDTVRTQDDMDKYEEIAKENLKDFSDRFVLIKQDSSEAAKEITEELDFVLIDGDHSKEGIEADLEAYYPLIKSGGYVFIHDTNAISVMDGIKAFKEKHKNRIPLQRSKNFTSFWVKK